ncbi:MAG TPA: SDR family NAD(P)-dependent oxidoreductase [Acidimicrobiales bacterium]|nr:SDR family NAD(P)-dependent oxidoreductase [Acidimicrobiales bacterium]
MEPRGRAALVTGGAGGLGSALVRHLVDAGCGVAILDLDAEKGQALADELGDRVVAVAGDVTDDGDVQAAIDAATGLGPLSIVVNVAGGGLGGGRTVGRDGTPHDRDAFVGTIDMNVLGTFNVSRFAAAAMSGNEPDDTGERGVIVNTASIAGLEGQTGQLAYATAKAAIVGMTLPMARDLSPLGIRVCAIAPGTMGTPLMLGLPEKVQQGLVDFIQFPKRLGEPSEYALLVDSIVRNPYLNGEVIRLDGALRFPPK